MGAMVKPLVEIVGAVVVTVGGSTHRSVGVFRSSSVQVDPAAEVVSSGGNVGKPRQAGTGPARGCMHIDWIVVSTSAQVQHKLALDY